MAEDRYVQFTAHQYRNGVRQVAERLRRLADEVEREGLHVPDGPTPLNTPRFTAAAERALHTLTWGVTNLHATDLVGLAGTVDAAERGDT